MNLQQLQTNVFSLIKSRELPVANDGYIQTLQSSSHVLLIKKIALWWRKTQIENSCLLVANLLKQRAVFDTLLSHFFRDQSYSSFREEIYMQFLQYLIATQTDSLIVSVAQFEFSVFKLKLGEPVNIEIVWQFEPYAVINGLLKNTLSEENLATGNYCLLVSSANKDELFTVKNLNS